MVEREDGLLRGRGVILAMTSAFVKEGLDVTVRSGWSILPIPTKGSVERMLALWSIAILFDGYLPAPASFLRSSFSRTPPIY